MREYSASGATVSVLIVAKDESLMISRCVKSALAVGPVFVVDSQSRDGTAEIAASRGAQVFPFEWDGQYPKKKQWALDNLPFPGRWVLLLDGDEIVSPRLAAEVRAVVQTSRDTAAYDATLSYYFLGRQLRHGHLIRKRILFDRLQMAFPELDDLGVDNPMEIELHVQPVPLIPGGSAQIGDLRTPLIHDDREPLRHYFDRHNRYSDWEAYLRSCSGASTQTPFRTRQGQVWARVPFKPLVFFLYAYVLRAGFLDGRAGFHYAVSQAFYYWQISLKTRGSLKSK